MAGRDFHWNGRWSDVLVARMKLIRAPFVDSPRSNPMRTPEGGDLPADVGIEAVRSCAFMGPKLSIVQPSSRGIRLAATAAYYAVLFDLRVLRLQRT